MGLFEEMKTLQGKFAGVLVPVEVDLSGERREWGTYLPQYPDNFVTYLRALYYKFEQIEICVNVNTRVIDFNTSSFSIVI